MQIYIAEGTQQTGPFDLETIKAGLHAGRYTPTQLAWYEGAPGWEPISQLPGMEVIAAPPPPPPSPAPAAYTPMPPTNPFAASPSAGYVPPPPTFIPVQSAPYVPGTGPGPAKKGILATVGTIFIGFVAVLFGIFRIMRVFLPHDSYGGSHTYSSTPAVYTPPPNSATAASSPPARGTLRFSPKRANYSGDLTTHFVGFTFDYPDSWVLKDNVEDAYVTAQHFQRLKNGRNVQVEFFEVSYAYGRQGIPLLATLSTMGPPLLDMITSPLMKDLPNAAKTPARTGRFGKYATEEVFITDHVNGGGIYCRCAVVAQDNMSSDGLSVTMTANDAAGSRSAETLGDTGGLRTIRDSFHFTP